PFELRDAPDPAADGRVRVHVRAAGVNFADVLVRRGRYPQMPKFPTILGSEIAGVLDDGTRVMAITSGGGGYASLAAVEAAQVVPLPDHASFAEGASFLLTFLTAYIPLTRQARVGPGTAVLVHAAAGGVGSAAVQVARALGADVVDPVGGDLFSAALTRLKPLGVVIAIGSAAGPWPDTSPGLLVGRNISVAGFYYRRLLRFDPHLLGAAVGEELGLWQAGAFR